MFINIVFAIKYLPIVVLETIWRLTTKIVMYQVLSDALFCLHSVYLKLIDSFIK